MNKKTEEYYILRLNNILLYMENNNYYDKPYVIEVAHTKQDIYNNGLTEKNLKRIKELNNYFTKNICNQKQKQQMENMWSNYKK